MSDEKDKDQKDQAAPAPRPDPVGERNYAMSEPVVRPAGEGTPGAMHHVAPSVPPVVEEKAKEPPVDVKDVEVREHAKVAPVAVPAVRVPAVVHPVTVSEAQADEIAKAKPGTRKK